MLLAGPNILQIKVYYQKLTEIFIGDHLNS